MVTRRHIVFSLATLSSLVLLASAGPVDISDHKLSSAETVTQIISTTIISTPTPTATDVTDEPVVTITEVLTTTTQPPATTTVVTDEPVVTITEILTTTIQSPTSTEAASPSLEAATPTVTVNTTQPVEDRIADLECWYFYDHHVGTLHWFVQATMIHDDDIHSYCGGLWDNLHHRSCTPSDTFCGPRRQPLYYTPGGVGVEPDGLGGGVPAWGTGLFWQFTSSTLCFPRQVEQTFYEATYKGKFGKLSCPVDPLRYNPRKFPGNEWYDPNLWGHNPYIADYNSLPITGETVPRSIGFSRSVEYNATPMAYARSNSTEVILADRKSLGFREFQETRDDQDVPVDTGADSLKDGYHDHQSNTTELRVIDLIIAREQDDIKFPPPHQLMSSAAGPEWHYNTSCLKEEHSDMRSWYNIKAPKVPLSAVDSLCADLQRYLLHDPGHGRVLCEPYYFVSHECRAMHPERGGIWWHWVNFTNDCHRSVVEEAWMEVTKGKWGPLFCYSGCDPIYDGTYPKWCKIQGVGDSPCC